MPKRNNKWLSDTQYSSGKQPAVTLIWHLGAPHHISPLCCCCMLLFYVRFILVVASIHQICWQWHILTVTAWHGICRCDSYTTSLHFTSLHFAGWLYILCLRRAKRQKQKKKTKNHSACLCNQWILLAAQSLATHIWYDFRVNANIC